MTLMIRLSDTFGANFRDCNEVDHLLALRGYLFVLLKQRTPGSAAHTSVHAAITLVGEILTQDFKVDLATRPTAPKELFDFYYQVVSAHWKWLNELRSNR